MIDNPMASSKRQPNDPDERKPIAGAVSIKMKCAISAIVSINAGDGATTEEEILQIAIKKFDEETSSISRTSPVIFDIDPETIETETWVDV